MASDHSHHIHDHPVENVTSMPADPMGHNHDDHSSHGAAGGAEKHPLHHMMEMSFHGGCTETILFEKWSIDGCWGLVGSMVVIFMLGVLYEGLKYYRENLFWKSYNSLQYRAVSAPEKNGTVEADNSRVVQPTIFSLMHFYQSFLHLIQVTLSLMLMLIFMTYNTWLCFAVVFGAMVGYFLFGWKKSVVVDVTEHCH